MSIFTLFSYYRNRLRGFILGKIYFGYGIKSIASNVKLIVASGINNFHPSSVISELVYIYNSGVLNVGARAIIKMEAILLVNNGDLTIGSDSAIGKRCEISLNTGSIIIGSNVRIASKCFYYKCESYFC